MLIRLVTIEPATSVKVYEKHGVLSEEIERALRDGKPTFKRVAGDQYVAIGLADRYLTVFFRYDKKTKEAVVTTAYPSSRRQVKAYKNVSR